MKDEIKEFEEFRNDEDGTYFYYIDKDGNEQWSYKLDNLKDYIINLQNKIEFKDLILKALHRYFTEHECYETHEFLRQLESCTENDMMWLKRMAGVNNE